MGLQLSCCLFSDNSCSQLGPSENSMCLERQEDAAAAVKYQVSSSPHSDCCGS